LQRSEERVRARAATCLFFVIPFKKITVDPVVGFGDRTKSGSEIREQGRTTSRRTESSGFLVINGPDQTAEVPVTPFNLQEVREKAEAFLKDPQAVKMKLFVVANWKFSVIAGGLATLPAVFYVIGAVLTLVRGFRRLIKFDGATIVMPADGTRPL